MQGDWSWAPLQFTASHSGSNGTKKIKTIVWVRTWLRKTTEGDSSSQTSGAVMGTIVKCFLGLPSRVPKGRPKGARVSDGGKYRHKSFRAHPPPAPTPPSPQKSIQGATITNGAGHLYTPKPGKKTKTGSGARNVAFFFRIRQLGNANGGGGRGFQVTRSFEIGEQSVCA